MALTLFSSVHSWASDGPNCTAQMTINGFTVYNPMVIPACLLAVVIGLYGGRVVRAVTPKTGSYSYSISYTMYCFMMWHSMLIHCITPSINNKLLTLFVALIDAGLTSCIAVSFMFNAFVDNNWLSETTCKGKATMFSAYVAVFAAWAVSLYYQWNLAFLVLYVGVIGLCCGLFLIAELYYLAKKAKWAGFGWLVLGGAFGVVGLYACVNPALVCQLSGKWYNASFWWDILSDLAMMALLKYYFASRIPTPASDGSEYEMHQVVALPLDNEVPPAAQPVVYMPMQYTGQLGQMYVVQ